MYNCWGLKKFLTHLFTMLSFFNSYNFVAIRQRVSVVGLFSDQDFFLLEF